MSIFRGLEELQLQGNQLEYLPDSLNKLESLKFLNLNSNPLKKNDTNALHIIDQLRETDITVYFFEEKFYESSKFTELTKDVILLILSNEWENYYTLIRKLGIKTMKDARDLQSKLKELHRNGLMLKEIKNGRTHWKKNKKPSSDII
ncbi:MAG: hypothetical protein ACFFCI_06945 [Promethearchaeota archaeon]